jgi:hypothetical protein
MPCRATSLVSQEYYYSHFLRRFRHRRHPVLHLVNLGVDLLGEPASSIREIGTSEVKINLPRCKVPTAKSVRMIDAAVHNSTGTGGLQGSKYGKRKRHQRIATFPDLELPHISGSICRIGLPILT